MVSHYIFGTLGELFTNQVEAPYNGTGTIGTCIYPSGDVDRKASGYFQGGFIDIANNALAHSWRGGVDVNEVANELERGLVGVLVQHNSTPTAAVPSKGDATRLWGDCAYGSNGAGGNAEPGCRRSFSLVEDVSHSDILP